jgi:heme exporter protein D
MPELGKYAFAVLSAYAVTIALVAGLVAISLLRGARIKKALSRVEREVREGRDGRA